MITSFKIEYALDVCQVVYLFSYDYQIAIMSLNGINRQCYVILQVFTAAPLKILLLDPEDDGTTILRNIRGQLLNNTAYPPGKLPSSETRFPATLQRYF